jgi:magnesium chelatase accessory protein
MSIEEVPEDWPNRQATRMVRGPKHHWHVQQAGTDGPDVLLLHGAGGSVHSFADLLPLLAEGTRVFAPDLPGHGYTKRGAQRRSGLQQMAEDLSALCVQEGIAPRAIIGHSAGGAIALMMGRMEAHGGATIIGINPALSPFEGLAGVLFPMLAKVLATVPFTSRLFSGVSPQPERVRALIDSTGSKLTDAQIELYRRLVAREAHVNGTLSMMAQWDLDPLLSHLMDITNRVHFITGTYDLTVPARISEDAARKIPGAQVTALDGYGHLVHEEIPDRVAQICRGILEQKRAALG